MKSISLEEFNSTLQATVYGQQYLELIQSVREQNRGKRRKKGFDLHHVHPKALGGKEGELILLTPYEHCLAHILIVKAMPCYETLMPITFLSKNRYRILSDVDKLTLEEAYKWSEELKRARKESIKKLQLIREATIEKSKASKAKHTEERKKEIVEKWRASMQKRTEEQKKKDVEKWKESVRNRTPEQKELIRQHKREAQLKRTPEQKAERLRKFRENYKGNAHKGKHWHVDSETGKHIYTD